jgi:hypothetical protein
MSCTEGEKGRDSQFGGVGMKTLQLYSTQIDSNLYVSTETLRVWKYIYLSPKQDIMSCGHVIPVLDTGSHVYMTSKQDTIWRI